MKILFILLLIFFYIPGNGQTPKNPEYPVETGYYTSFDSTKIYYEVAGKGKPVLLIHGFIVDGQSWKRTALYNDLLKQNYQVILLDMRGNGKSGKPHNAAAYANDAEPKDIMGLMDLLKISKYAAVGYSRGSIITARLLVLDKRVSAAVMGGMGIEFTNPEWPRRLMFYHALVSDTVAELQPMVAYVKKEGLDQQALALLQKEQPSASVDAMKKITQPVLLIHGSEDQYSTSAADLQKIMKNARLKLTPGDHNHASGTPEFSRVIISFLKENY